MITITNKFNLSTLLEQKDSFIEVHHLITNDLMINQYGTWTAFSQSVIK